MKKIYESPVMEIQMINAMPMLIIVSGADCNPEKPVLAKDREAVDFSNEESIW